MIKTGGINHPAFAGRDYTETVNFYTKILGMRLVLEQPNLDDADSTHLFFEAGPGQFIAYFVPRTGSRAATPPPRGVGNVLHLALNLEIPLEDAMAALDEAGVRYKGPIDRGYERSIYFRDPNGTVIELLTWITPVPAGVDEGDLIVSAQRLRVERGATFIEDQDVRAAIEARKGT